MIAVDHGAVAVGLAVAIRVDVRVSLTMRPTRGCPSSWRGRGARGQPERCRSEATIAAAVAVALASRYSLSALIVADQSRATPMIQGVGDVDLHDQRLDRAPGGARCRASRSRLGQRVEALLAGLDDQRSWWRGPGVTADAAHQVRPPPLRIAGHRLGRGAPEPLVVIVVRVCPATADQARQRLGQAPRRWRCSGSRRGCGRRPVTGMSSLATRRRTSSSCCARRQHEQRVGALVGEDAHRRLVRRRSGLGVRS